MKKSRPARIRDQIKELPGWSVSATLSEDDVRGIWASHEDGRVVRMTFVRVQRSRVTDVLTVGQRYDKTGEEVNFTNVAETLRWMAAPAVVPFDPETTPDAEVLAALAGHTITWRSSTTGKTLTGEVPRGGAHLRLVGGVEVGGKRALTFADPRHGFRSVAIERIEKVSS